MADPTVYLQEGATISSLESYTDFTSGFMNVTLPTSTPYPTGYEFNAVSNTGDWYQVMVHAANWPQGSCTSLSLYDSFEIWNNTGSSVIYNCDLTSNPSSGDTVALSLYVASDGDVCLEVYDWTHTAQSNTDCETQPDPGATPSSNYFVLQSTASNSNGYFTGPMTEVPDSETSCVAYTGLPLVTYYWGGTSEHSALDVATYVLWSDEFELGGSLCYVDSTTAPLQSDYSVLVGGQTVQITRYFEASGGSTYGPHWVGSQEVASGWRFQSDVVPLQAPTVSFAPTGLDLGGAVTFSPAAAGGSGSYDFSVGVSGPVEAVLSGTAWSPPLAGAYAVAVLVTDSQGDANASQAASDLTVYPDPTQAPPVPSQPSADVGQRVTFTASESGGSGGGSFVWSSGALSGCGASTSAVMACTPTVAGSFTVSYVWTDSSGFVASGDSDLNITVYSDPTVSIPVPSTPSQLEGRSVTFSVTASGGSGGFHYNWSGLPRGCSSADVASLRCTPTGYGTFQIQVTVTDSDGFTVSSAPLSYTVNPAVLGLPRAEGDALLGGALAAVAAVIVAVAAVWLARRRKR